MSIFENNRALLDRFRRGDRAALSEVYFRYVDEVATLARRGFTMESSGHVYVRGAGSDGEHELVQETFAKAFAAKAREAYDGVSAYRPYLLRITKNLMIDRYRADRKHAPDLELDRELGVGNIDTILAANAALVADVELASVLHWNELRAVTTDYIATLDAQSRELIALRFEAELSQEDTAARMGCSRRRVRTLEQRVQEDLRKLLQRNRLLE